MPGRVKSFSLLSSRRRGASSGVVGDHDFFVNSEKDCKSVLCRYKTIFCVPE